MLLESGNPGSKSTGESSAVLPYVDWVAGCRVIDPKVGDPGEGRGSQVQQEEQQPLVPQKNRHLFLTFWSYVCSLSGVVS